MKSMLHCAVSIIIYLLAVTNSQNTIDEKHEIVLNNEFDVELKWRVDEGDVFFEMSAKTLGYVAVGFSPNGGMPGSDIVVGWVKDGEAFISDRHATGFIKPEADTSDDYELLYGYEEGGKTTVGFKRKLDTCDPNDYTISADTARVIWAVNDNDPTVEPDDLMYHGSSRGVRSVVLLDSSFKLPDLPPDSEHFDILMPNIPVPGDDTTYWCTPFETPKFEDPVQVFRFDTVVQQGHEALVHHIVLFGCYGNYSSIAHYSQVCDRLNMPPDLRHCVRMIYAWAIGGGSFVFPDNVGISLGGLDDPTFFYIETHYDNPGLKTDFVDSSGLRIHYTRSRERQYDADVWVIGESFTTLTHMIPPKETDFKTFGVCSSECTNTSMSEDINVFAVILHGHLALRQATIQHYRNGKLIDEIRDSNYDFNLQEIRKISERVFKPGDEYVMTCSYNTMDRDNVTFGGESTMDEMCLGFMFYYPRNPKLNSCVSGPSMDSVVEILDLDDRNLKAIEKLDAKQIKDGLTEVSYKADRYDICGFLYFNPNNSFPEYFKDDDRIIKQSSCPLTNTNGSNRPMRAAYWSTIMLFVIFIMIL